VDDIERVYNELSAKEVVFLSSPQVLEVSGYKSKAVYFLDPDGSIPELMETPQA